MEEEIQMMIDEMHESMDKALDHLHKELIKIRAGKASPAMLNGVVVEAYGMSNPLNQVANISVPDARTLAIQPFDKSIIQAIEKGILQSNIGLTPQNDGLFIRLNIPPLTEERRKSLVKQSQGESEQAKIGLRAARKDAMDFIKDLKKEGLSEDREKDLETLIQNTTTEYGKKIDDILKAKEVEIMAI
jgi:ribosome recycling factor